jgi:hypothetical protein
VTADHRWNTSLCSGRHPGRHLGEEEPDDNADERRADRAAVTQNIGDATPRQMA